MLVLLPFVRAHQVNTMPAFAATRDPRPWDALYREPQVRAGGPVTRASVRPQLFIHTPAFKEVL
jgi:hypothetical protein